MNKIIDVDQLSKNFGNVQAVKNISFYVEKGSLFSFLGTNGAGKSTTISMILTLLKKDKGRIIVNGHTVGKDNKLIRKEIGVVFQDSLLDSLLTVKENLQIRSSFYPMSKEERKNAINKVVNITGLTSFLDRPDGKLSGGERRRVDIVRALMHKPFVLILDASTTGLDAQSRKNIWETIKQLQQKESMTVFLTTHYIEEAAESDFVVIMNKGEIVAKGTPEQLKSTYSTHMLMINTKHLEKMKNLLRNKEISYKLHKQTIHIPLKKTIDAIAILNECQQYISSFEVKQSSIDDVFLAITSEGIDESVSIY